MLVLDTLEIEALVSMVSQVASGESQLCQSALMWLAVNQMRQSHGRRTLSEICDSIRVLCGGRSGPSLSRPALQEERVASLRQRARSVLLAQEVDPTFGACRVHRHDECPDWSQIVSPSALIGPFFFYPAQAGA